LTKDFQTRISNVPLGFFISFFKNKNIPGIAAASFTGRQASGVILFKPM
jgi:hypothetical protein